VDPADDGEDVPYGEDWQSIADTTAWTEAADKKRPWRARVRSFISDQVATLRPGARVLELGSGPGFLAERVLQCCPHLGSYTLFDFSEPMIAMSRERLARFPTASFLLGNFKADDWGRNIEGQFDGILSMQAVHEVRHKRHVPRLYQQIYRVTATSGLVLICDHVPWDDSRWSTALFMTQHEQTHALSAAGFAEVGIAMSIEGLVVYQCRRAG
jgi:SAM-dependent methyltransferase